MKYISLLAAFWLLALSSFIGGVVVFILQGGVELQPQSDGVLLTEVEQQGSEELKPLAANVRQHIQAVKVEPGPEIDSLKPVSKQAITLDGKTLAQQSLFEAGYDMPAVLIQAKQDVLLLQGNQVLHSWQLPASSATETIDQNSAVPFALQLQADGSVISNAKQLEKISVCSQPVWRKAMAANFSSGTTTSDAIWVIEGTSLLKLASDTGEILKRIDWDEVRAKNKTAFLDLGLYPARNEWLETPWDLVDVEPLPAELAAAFPRFAEGDLLLSFRALSLIVVLAPENLEVKWWRAGASRRQTDIDWSPSGNFTLLNLNSRMEKGLWKDLQRFSQILEINPDNYQANVRYSGEAHSLYFPVWATHDIDLTGFTVIADSEAKRVLGFTKDQKLAFQIIAEPEFELKNAFLVDRKTVDLINKRKQQCKK